MLMSKCEYSIHIKGNKQSALIFCAITKRDGKLCIDKEIETDDGKVVIWISGECKDCKDLYGTLNQSSTIDPTSLDEREIRAGAQLPQFFDLTIRRKSEMLGLEIIVRSKSKEDNFDQIEHYKNGFFLKIIGDFYKEDNEFEFEF